MTGDLHQIFRRIGFGRFKIGDDYLIDIRLECGEIRAAILKPRAIEDRMSDVTRMLTG